MDGIVMQLRRRGTNHRAAQPPHQLNDAAATNTQQQQHRLDGVLSKLQKRVLQS